MGRRGGNAGRGGAWLWYLLPIDVEPLMSADEASTSGLTLSVSYH